MVEADAAVKALSAWEHGRTCLRTFHTIREASHEQNESSPHPERYLPHPA